MRKCIEIQLSDCPNYVRKIVNDHIDMYGAELLKIESCAYGNYSSVSDTYKAYLKREYCYDIITYFPQAYSLRQDIIISKDTITSSEIAVLMARSAQLRDIIKHDLVQLDKAQICTSV